MVKDYFVHHAEELSSEAFEYTLPKISRELFSEAYGYMVAEYYDDPEHFLSPPAVTTTSCHFRRILGQEIRPALDT